MEAMAAATEPTAVVPSKAGEDTEVVAVPAEVNLPVVIRDEDPDPVGSGDFWPSGSGTFFNGSGSYL